MTAQAKRGPRYRASVRLAVRFGLQLWWLAKTRAFFSPERQRERETALYTRQARRFREFAIAMGGLIVKLGQFLSIRIDFLPKEYIDELSGLQDALPPVPTPAIAAVVERELGRPLTEVFTDFGQEPLAAASLGQVHQARLASGEPVAVKVLRPGIEDLVETDLKAIRRILELVPRFTRFLSKAEADLICRDFEATFREELDYGLEGKNCEAFQRNFLLHPGVEMPKIYWDASSRRVLTMEFMAGVKIDDLAAIEAQGIDRAALAQNLLEIYLQMFLRDGFFHADPHPGNVFVRPDGVIQLIDFGMVGRIGDEARRAYADLIMAIVGGDSPGVADALDRLGFLTPGTDRRLLLAALGPLLGWMTTQLGTLFQGHAMLDAMVSGQGVGQFELDGDFLETMRQFILTQPIQLPGNTTFMGKAFITVVTDCFRLDPGLDLIAVCRPWLEAEAGTGLWDWLAKLAADSGHLVKNLLPTAKRVVSLVERLDNGTYEVTLTPAQLDRLAPARSRETTRVIRAVAAGTLTLAGVVVLVGSPVTWLGVTLTALGGLALLIAAR